METTIEWNDYTKQALQKRCRVYVLNPPKSKKVAVGKGKAHGREPPQMLFFFLRKSVPTSQAIYLPRASAYLARQLARPAGLPGASTSQSSMRENTLASG